MTSYTSCETVILPNIFRDIDLNSTHHVIGAFMDALQNHFRDDTQYPRPLIAPQGNIIFAIDREVAQQMRLYISAKMVEIGGFAEDEFHFTQKADSPDALQRLRLEFASGVTCDILRKIIKALGDLNSKANYTPCN